MILDEKSLRKILEVVTRLDKPTTAAISEATGISKHHIDKYLKAAQRLGFVDRLQLS